MRLASLVFVAVATLAATRMSTTGAEELNLRSDETFDDGPTMEERRGGRGRRRRRGHRPYMHNGGNQGAEEKKPSIAELLAKDLQNRGGITPP
uniref:Uncharacterized protein n=1 Tax=Peronospora matthiolae TaxID=2874970 RepID=A0AAV1TAV8_9STRA